MSWTEPGTRRGTEKAKAGRKMKKKQTHIHTHPWKPTSSTIIILWVYLKDWCQLSLSSVYAGPQSASSFSPSISAPNDSVTLPLCTSALVSPPPLTVPALAAVHGDGLGCLPGPMPEAGTAGQGQSQRLWSLWMLWLQRGIRSWSIL